MIARARAILEAFGRVMSRVWLTVLYFTLILPFGIMARLRKSGQERVALAWRERKEAPATLEEARRQY